MKRKGFKSQLLEIDRLIKGFEAISLRLPLCAEYKSAIVKLQQDRVELTSKIGVKK